MWCFCCKFYRNFLSAGGFWWSRTTLLEKQLNIRYMWYVLKAISTAKRSPDSSVLCITRLLQWKTSLSEFWRVEATNEEIMRVWTYRKNRYNLQFKTEPKKRCCNHIRSMPNQLLELLQSFKSSNTWISYSSCWVSRNNVWMLSQDSGSPHL